MTRTLAILAAALLLPMTASANSGDNVDDTCASAAAELGSGPSNPTAKMVTSLCMTMDDLSEDAEAMAQDLRSANERLRSISREYRGLRAQLRAAMRDFRANPDKDYGHEVLKIEEQIREARVAWRAVVTRRAQLISDLRAADEYIDFLEGAILNYGSGGASN